MLSVSLYLLEQAETDFLFPEANYHSLNGAHYVISRFILILAYSPLIRIDHDNYYIPRKKGKTIGGKTRGGFCFFVYLFIFVFLLQVFL